MFQSLYGAHVREIQRRWETAMEAEGYDGIVVYSGTPLVSFLDDYVYPFRANPHFQAWLPLSHHPDSVLLIRSGEKPLLWFFQPEDYWHLPPADPETWWADHFDIRVVSDQCQWLSELPVPSARFAALGDSPALKSKFDHEHINPKRVLVPLHVARTRKTPYEIACMKAASLAGAKAHLAAENAFRSGHSEFEIHQAYLQACEHSDQQLPYGSIVALNEHAAVLHYQNRDRVAPTSSFSFLIDAGCTCNTYASDITRTYAAHDGEFADLILAMEQMQLGLASSVISGLDFKELHLDTHLRIADILASAGIIHTSAENAVESGLSGVFYPHGLGHYIGLQTHDVAGLHDDGGRAIEPPQGHPFLRLTRTLESGNVLTIEPGLYFIDSLLSRWKSESDASLVNWDAVSRLRSYGGIRIEDNVVVTESQPENLTREAFAALS